LKHFFVHNKEGNADISQNGIDWQAVSTDELSSILNTLRQDKDVAIIYSRENPNQDVNSQTMELFKIIESAKIPIKLVKRKGSDGSGESEPNNEASYVNCLLVTLAKSPRSIAAIKSGQSVPDIEKISNNPSELPWIRGLPFNYNQLKADIVNDVIKRIPSKRLGLFSSNREFTAKMVLSEGKSESVKFVIKQSKSQDGIQQIEINRIQY
jgi:hypothetical protein